MHKGKADEGTSAADHEIKAGPEGRMELSDDPHHDEGADAAKNCDGEIHGCCSAAVANFDGKEGSYKDGKHAKIRGEENSQCSLCDKQKPVDLPSNEDVNGGRKKKKYQKNTFCEAADADAVCHFSCKECCNEK